MISISELNQKERKSRSYKEFRVDTGSDLYFVREGCKTVAATLPGVIQQGSVDVVPSGCICGYIWRIVSCSEAHPYGFQLVSNTKHEDLPSCADSQAILAFVLDNLPCRRLSDWGTD